MTKQDIYDIIQILDDHFQSIGLEVRDELLFNIDYTDFFPYNSKYLFSDKTSGDLTIYYKIPSELTQYYSDTIKNLENQFKVAEFNIKVFKYLSQEFKVSKYQRDGENGFYFTIEDNNHNERIKLKRYND